MSLAEWLIFISIASLQIALPGPAVVLAAINGAQQGFKKAAYAITGDLLATGSIACISILGASALLLSNIWLFNSLKIIGALYLIYLGIKSLISAHQASSPVANSSIKPLANNKPLAVMWKQAFFVAITNPKAILFFGALFPQFLEQTAFSWIFCAKLLVIFLAIKWLILAFYAYGASQFRKLNVSPALLKLSSYIKGVSFLGFGSVILKSTTTRG